MRPDTYGKSVGAGIALLIGAALPLASCEAPQGNPPGGPPYVIVEREYQTDYMHGLPPPPDSLIDSDHSWALDPEKGKWSFQNISKILPTEFVSRGTGPVLPLTYEQTGLLQQSFTAPDSNRAPLQQILKGMGVDGFILLKDGVVQTEAYFNGFGPTRRHIGFSVTKSLVGSLMGILVHEGRVDLAQTVAHYLPELAGSGYGDATVRQVLDMTTNVVWNHDRADPTSQVDLNSRAGGFQSRPADFPYPNTLKFLQSVEKAGRHGEAGLYNPGNTETLGWIISRLEGRNWQEAFAERIWSRLGAERDAQITVDPGGHGFATAGFSATLRDFARFGLMLEQEGRLNGEQILPADWLLDVRTGDARALAAWQASEEAAKRPHVAFYRNHFRVLNGERGEFVAQGHMGQRIYVNMESNVVAVFLAVTPSRPLRSFQVDLIREIDASLERRHATGSPELASASWECRRQESPPSVRMTSCVSHEAEASSGRDRSATKPQAATCGPERLEPTNRSHYMRGVPVAPDRIVTDGLAWARDYEQVLWSHQNVSKILRVDPISRGEGPVSALPYGDCTLATASFAGKNGEPAPLKEILAAIGTDGFILVREGAILAELYYNGFAPDARHQLNSVSKSFVGLLAGIAQTEGRLNLERPLGDVLPELAGAGVANASLQHALDMALGVETPMSWDDPRSYRLLNFMAGGFHRRFEEFPYRNTLELAATVPANGEHGRSFFYSPVNTEIVAWSISRAYRRNWQEVLAEKLWSRLGAERDAIVIVDPAGHGFASAGIGAALRDLARLGLVIEGDGHFFGRQIVPRSWIRRTIAGNDGVRQAMNDEEELARFGPAVFYHNQFRVLDNSEGELLASGGLGQLIYVNQEHDLVAVFLATTFDDADRAHQVNLLRQIRDHLKGS
ncbi:MAG: serine hydrolase [Gammaproteobacteria bacterium]|nr:serine hydrolase [Gammaproteobacteria bacterium]